MTKFFLERSGEFSVDITTSAPDAIGMIREQRYDAIVSDYQMPEMDGIEFLKRVRASGNTIPFIIFTGRGREEVVIQALNEGADFYLQKGGEPKSQFAELSHQIRQSVQQRRAETSIRDLERREADIINFLPDATFAIDTRGVVIAWNRAMEQMTSIRAAEILGKGDYAYAVPFYRERRPILIDLVLRDDPAITAKYPYIIRDGRSLISEITIPHFNNGKGASLWFIASPLYDTRGAIVGAIESTRDITGRKHAEEALHESEEKYRTLFDEAADLIAIVDMQGKFLNLNKKFEEESGYRREEMIGRNVLMSGIVTAPSAAKIAYNLNLISDRKESPIFEIDGISKGGRIVPYEVRSTPVEKAGRVVAVQATLRNISDRRQAETAVRESQKWLEEIVKGSPIPQFVIDRKHRVISWNRALEEYSEVKSEEVLGTTLAWKAFYEVERPVMADLLVDNSIDKIPVWYAGKYNRSKYVEGAYEATDFFPRMGKAGIWLFFTASAIRDSNGAVIGAVETLEDVTDIKEKEIVLHASEERYRTIVENIQDVVYRSDLHGNLVMASPSCAALLGYESIDDCLGKNIAAEFYMYPEKRQEILDAVNRHGAVKDYEVVLKRKDGTPLTVSTSSHVYFDKSGVPLGIEGVFRDITERKRAEDALRESEQRYRCLLGALFDAVVIHQDGRIVAANNAALAMIGAQKPDDVIGRPVMQFVHPVSQSSVRERIRQMSEKPAVTVPLIEEKFVRPDGTVFDTEVVATGFILDGKPAVQVVFRDITDRKEAEEELRNSEEKYRTIFENTGTATVLVEENTIISLANAEFERLSGYTKEEIEGKKSWTEFVVKEDLQRMLAQHHLRKENREAALRHYEFRFAAKSGAIRDIFLTIDVIPGTKRSVASLLDVTDRKKGREWAA